MICLGECHGHLAGWQRLKSLQYVQELRGLDVLHARVGDWDVLKAREKNSCRFASLGASDVQVWASCGYGKHCPLRRQCGWGRSWSAYIEISPNSARIASLASLLPKASLALTFWRDIFTLVLAFAPTNHWEDRNPIRPSIPMESAVKTKPEKPSDTNETP
ncbi:hypothetical protein O181_027093 [Austropuccinia psidii MF-1]|uniref:Uncharacterized protein n=1 Tax=Austropuccinia psidii MF-1 TaxID=1389203 RepID=A0A9Q3CR43_9BASI|nr:hypothetical protein [Austropuccinia psidii MF-1]